MPKNIILVNGLKLFLLMILIFARNTQTAAQNSELINPFLLKEEWKAKWITFPGISRKEYGVYLFRKNVTVTDEIKKFVVHVSADNRYKLYVAETDFTDTIFIAEGLIGDYDWQSDSKSIVYSLLDRVQGNHDLWESGIDGLTKKRISNTPENEEILCYSCDGNYIAYSDWNSIYYTPINSFTPIQIIDNARLPKWIPNRNLILYFNEQNEDNLRFWTESWIVDLNGNVVKKIAEGEASSTSFSSTGDYYVYSVKGNIWLDYLPL